MLMQPIPIELLRPKSGTTDQFVVALPNGTSLIDGNFTSTSVSINGNITVTGTSDLNGLVTLGIDAATNTAGSLKLWSAGANDFYTTLTAGTQTANATYTLPVAMPTANSLPLICSTAGVMSWSGNFGANNITTTGEGGFGAIGVDNITIDGVTISSAASLSLNAATYVDISSVDDRINLSSNTYLNDNVSISFGTSGDATIYYDATNLRINPKAVGTGACIVEGRLFVNRLDTNVDSAAIMGISNDGSTGAEQYSYSSAAATTSPYQLFRRSRGSYASKSAVQSGDRIGGSFGGGYDGAAFQNSMGVGFYIDGAVSSGVVPGRISFDTGTSAGTRTARLNIASSGLVSIYNNVVIGAAAAGVDYTLTFDGETSDGVVTWMEDEAYFKVSDFLRADASDYRRYYHMGIGKFNPGASGAVWTAPNANTAGGYQLDAATEVLYFDTDVHSDWDGTTDLTVEVSFEVNVDNTGGGAGDTVDLKLVCYYKAVGDTATKTQTQEVATVVGASAQYKAFKATFTINFDEVGNVVEAGDKIHFILNLETDTSEVDNIIINHASFYYRTTHVGIESGDT